MPYQYVPGAEVPMCTDCGKPCIESKLQKQFRANVCDLCRDVHYETKYCCVTKTEVDNLNPDLSLSLSLFLSLHLSLFLSSLSLSLSSSSPPFLFLLRPHIHCAHFLRLLTRTINCARFAASCEQRYCSSTGTDRCVAFRWLHCVVLAVTLWRCRMHGCAVQAKDDYLLRDEDLEVAWGGLRCIERKNRRHESWAPIKLYLLAQVEALSFERYGGEDGLDEELERRQNEKRRRKEAKAAKAIKQLRKQTSTPRWLKAERANAAKSEAKRCTDHDYEDEVYDESTDMWSKKCKLCDHAEEYEKM